MPNYIRKCGSKDVRKWINTQITWVYLSKGMDVMSCSASSETFIVALKETRAFIIYSRAKITGK